MITYNEVFETPKGSVMLHISENGRHFTIQTDGFVMVFKRKQCKYDKWDEGVQDVNDHIIVEALVNRVGTGLFHDLPVPRSGFWLLSYMVHDLKPEPTGQRVRITVFKQGKPLLGFYVETGKYS